MKRTLVFATNNAGKAREVQAMLGGHYTVQTLADIGCTVDIPETADSLEGNAYLKAAYVAEHYNLDCFADDTGLEIEALDGAPGVHTARFAGEGKDNNDNMNKVLELLEDAPNRKAQFRTSVCLLLGGRQHAFQGVAKGQIVHHRSGAGGFGYDPIFQPEGWDCTFAEMTLEDKNLISHRGQAIGQLVEFLSLMANH